MFFFFADFYQPFKEDELEQSTEVQIMFPSEPPVSFLACNECVGGSGRSTENCLTGAHCFGYFLYNQALIFCLCRLCVNLIGSLTNLRCVLGFSVTIKLELLLHLSQESCHLCAAPSLCVWNCIHCMLNLEMAFCASVSGICR